MNPISPYLNLSILVRNGFPVIKHGDQIAVTFPGRRYEDFFTAGSIVGYAIESGEDPFEAVERELYFRSQDKSREQTSPTHWLNHNSTVLSDSKAFQERDAAIRAASRRLKLGDHVIFDNKVFRVDRAPNDNPRLARLPHAEAADLVFKAAREERERDEAQIATEQALGALNERTVAVTKQLQALAVPGASPAPSDFNKRLDGYVEGVEKLAQAELDRYTTKIKGERPKVYVSIQRGPKYARIVLEERWAGDASGPANARVHTFVDLTNGNVLKAAGWKAPEKRNPRSNINDADFGLSGVTHHGAKYLR